MQLALEYGIEPKNMAIGAMAGIVVLLKKANEYKLPDALRLGNWQQLDANQIEKIINWFWSGKANQYTNQIIKYTATALKPLTLLIKE
jgi:hypothetical protein